MCNVRGESFLLVRTGRKPVTPGPKEGLDARRIRSVVNKSGERASRELGHRLGRVRRRQPSFVCLRTADGDGNDQNADRVSTDVEFRRRRQTNVTDDSTRNARVSPFHLAGFPRSTTVEVCSLRENPKRTQRRRRIPRETRFTVSNALFLYISLSFYAYTV